MWTYGERGTRKVERGGVAVRGERNNQGEYRKGGEGESMHRGRGVGK